MVSLPTFDNLTNAQMKTLIDAFKPYDGATNAEAAAEYKRWLRAKVLAEVQRRLYIKLHSGLGTQEQAIVESVNAAIPDPDAPVDTPPVDVPPPAPEEVPVPQPIPTE